MTPPAGKTEPAPPHSLAVFGGVPNQPTKRLQRSAHDLGSDALRMDLAIHDELHAFAVEVKGRSGVLGADHDSCVDTVGSDQFLRGRVSIPEAVVVHFDAWMHSRDR